MLLVHYTIIDCTAYNILFWFSNRFCSIFRLIWIAKFPTEHFLFRLKGYATIVLHLIFGGGTTTTGGSSVGAIRIPAPECAFKISDRVTCTWRFWENRSFFTTVFFWIILYCKRIQNKSDINTKYWIYFMDNVKSKLV